MEIKDLLPFIVVIAYGLWARLFKKPAVRRSEKKGVGSKLIDFFTALKAASLSEQQRQGSPMERQAWTASQPVSRTTAQENTISPAAVRPSAMESYVKPPARPAAKKKAPVVKEEYRQPMALPAKVKIVPEKKAAAKKFSKQQLRQAMVWAEILGPPVGLRD